ncbi:hemicentin-1-like [Oppia nitens]|uniref:hemicentin-1-like n=1 Tax=Oppia nitens TaxID=1686743 RepID=UPI0023DC5BD1|nr:hemicentin-1-like [Oppia nitens]
MTCRSWTISELRAVVGGQISLPCNTSLWIEDDVSLLVWYKGSTGIPIYSVDARTSRLANSKQVPGDQLAGRAVMDMSRQPPSLTLDPVVESDEDEYQCRVDYRKHRTQQFLFHLNVTVPPKQVIIKDMDGNRLRDVIGPYDEGQSLTIVCEAYGGRPLPSLKWFGTNGVQLDDTSAVGVLSTDQLQTYVKNELHLPKLSRDQLLMELVCLASQGQYDDVGGGGGGKHLPANPTNNNTSATNIATNRASVKLELNLKPLEVTIITPNKPLSAGIRTEIKCRASGSRPVPQIFWFKGQKKMPEVRDSVANDGNATISTLSFIPAIEDNGQQLCCRADNHQMTDEEIETNRILTVHYVPQVTLAMGANIGSQIREGSDVYFECTVRSNPWVIDVGWLFEGRPLYSDTANGIIVSNQSLVLQKVKREHRGRYQCTATNVEGQSASNKLFLKVNFAPVCKPGQTLIYGVARNEKVNITCQVDAEPDIDLGFRWLFNNSVDKFELKDYRINGSHSVAAYVPHGRANYGTVYCWASNQIGKQKEPCAYNIVAAGPPNPVNDCYVTNVTLSTLLVHCEPGDNGGLRQTFHLQVYNNDRRQLHTNLTAYDLPVFNIRDLPPATGFTLNVYAFNSKGKSDSIAINARTAQLPERHARKDGSNDVPLSPIVGVLIGIIASVIIICLITVFIIRCKVNRNNQYKEETELNSKYLTTTSCEPKISGEFKDSNNSSHMNLIYDNKSDTFGFTDITLDGKSSFANSMTTTTTATTTTIDNQIHNTCQLLADHQSTGFMPSVFYKSRGPDVTYAELSIVCPMVANTANERLMGCRSSHSHQLVGCGVGGLGIGTGTQYALIDASAAADACPSLPPNSMATVRCCSPSISSHQSIPDGCSESEITLETPLVNSVRHKFYTHETSNPDKSATHV